MQFSASEWILFVTAAVQAVSAVIVAVATVRYTRYTKGMLDVQGVPPFYVMMRGNATNGTISVENGSLCELRNANVVVSVGFMDNGRRLPHRLCIFSQEFKILKPKQRVSLHFDVAAVIPNSGDSGAEYSDMLLEYGFEREADGRRFAFACPVELYSGEGSTKYFSSLDDPQPIASLNRRIFRRVEQDASAELSASDK